MRVVITGSTGYIGSHLTDLGLQRGFGVVMATRQRPYASATSWLPYDLTSDSVVALPDSTTAVVHLAANTTHDSLLSDEQERAAARKLIESARNAGARFVFVSSQTARPDAPTAYGRIKWRIEQDVLAAGGWVVRPGQVYGGRERGLFATLVSVVRHLPLVPAFLPAPKVQPIHVDDLAKGLLSMAVDEGIEPRVWCLASSEPVTFTCFLMAIAAGRLRRCRLPFPIPTIIVQAMALMVGPPSLRASLGLDRLSSLFDLPVMETANDLQRIGLVLRPLRSGMHPSGDGRRRQLIEEGRSMLTYVLRERPKAAVMRHYVHVIEQLRDGAPLGLPPWAIGLPVMLALLDDKAYTASARGVEFAWRLEAATVLAEATPQGARRFFDRKPGALMGLARMSYPVFAEISWRVLRIPCKPFLRRYMNAPGGCQ